MDAQNGLKELKANPACAIVQVCESEALAEMFSVSMTTSVEVRIIYLLVIYDIHCYHYY
jgi:hypothetical protein